MRRVYLVAHPEAEHHVDNLVGGWYDSELTDRGRRQASLIAHAIRDLVPVGESVALHTSDLARTKQTADRIASVLRVEPVLHSKLREKSYGVAEGKPQAWLNERFVPPPAQGNRMDHHEGIEGSETKRMFAERVYEAMTAVEANPATHQVVVTHGFAVSFAIAAWIRVPLDGADYLSFRSSSGGVSVLGEDDYYHNRAVLSLNDTAHLNVS